MKYPIVEPIILSLSEFKRQIKLNAPLVKELIEKGIILVDELKLFSKLEQKFSAGQQKV